MGPGSSTASRLTPGPTKAIGDGETHANAGAHQHIVGGDAPGRLGRWGARAPARPERVLPGLADVHGEPVPAAGHDRTLVACLLARRAIDRLCDARQHLDRAGGGWPGEADHDRRRVRWRTKLGARWPPARLYPRHRPDARALGRRCGWRQRAAVDARREPDGQSPLVAGWLAHPPRIGAGRRGNGLPRRPQPWPLDDRSCRRAVPTGARRCGTTYDARLGARRAEDRVRQQPADAGPAHSRDRGALDVGRRSRQGGAAAAAGRGNALSRAAGLVARRRQDRVRIVSQRPQPDLRCSHRPMAIRCR